MPVNHLDEPTPEAARTWIADAIEVGHTVIVVGRCEVQYEGRAASYLGPGDRFVVLKPDGTLLVHTAEGRMPVNWQPPGCVHEADVVDGRLHVRSRRPSPTESVEVRFETVDGVSVLDMEDEGELELSGTEADLRDRLLEHPDLIEGGFEAVETEYRTGVGAADVFGRDRNGRAVVVELKRGRVGPIAVDQLRRYVDAIRENDPETRGVLVAPSITPSARDLLAERDLEYVRLDPRPDAASEAD